MLTVHPSIMLGSYLLDEDRLPTDEFDLRIQPLRDAMRERDLAAMLVYGDAREHQALAYFSNFIPRMRWAMALFPAQGAPRLLASMSSRDIPAMRTMTWVGDVKSGWEWKWFDSFVEGLGPSGRIGTIGLDDMTPLLLAQVEKTTTGHFDLFNCDDVATEARRVQRPREIAILRDASALTQKAADEIAARWRAGDDVERAALAGERVARAGAAQDVRTLVSRNGGKTLELYAARFDDRPMRLLAYVAVKFLGYWSECFVSLGAPDDARRHAERGMDLLIEGLRPGASIGELAHRVSAVAGPQHAALGGSYGHRIGLSPREGGAIAPGSYDAVLGGTTYALRVGDETGAMSSAVVALNANGTREILVRRNAEE
jgi:Xaa-Pro aminopeptidase